MHMQQEEFIVIYPSSSQPRDIVRLTSYTIIRKQKRISNAKIQLVNHVHEQHPYLPILS